MADSGTKLSMDYSALQQAAAQATGKANELDELMTAMTKLVTSMCDGWTAKASPVFLADYQTLAKSANNIAELVRQLSTEVNKYTDDMSKLDLAYSSSKISVGQ